MNSLVYVFSRVVRVHPHPMVQQTGGDPYSGHLALVQEVIPDVLPEHAMKQIKKLYPIYEGHVVQIVIQDLFDKPSYPKVNHKNRTEKGEDKRRASGVNDTSGGPPQEVIVDFMSVERPKPTGKNYRSLTLNQLAADFPYIPDSHIRRALASNDELYTPTHVQLASEMASDAPPLKLKTAKSMILIRPRVNIWKGKQREIRDEEFDKERTWLLQDRDTAMGLISPVVDCNIQCECCFSSSPFFKMVQCPDAHLFCAECVVTYASNLLGGHDVKIVCMSQSGCKLPFPDSELKRSLTPRLLSLYEKVKQAKEIEMAGLDGLEECPHCDFKIVMEDQSEKLFRCQNEDCGAITCRMCKKQDHLPKSCADAEDNKIKARHVVEEAMSSALMRNCPKCKKAFVKESGCNSMICPNCRTPSCYICRQIIPSYDHFYGEKKTCVLWDNTEERHGKEVNEAEKNAIADYRKEHPEVSAGSLQVKVPRAGVGLVFASLFTLRKR